MSRTDALAIASGLVAGGLLFGFYDPHPVEDLPAGCQHPETGWMAVSDVQSWVSGNPKAEAGIPIEAARAKWGSCSELFQP